MRRNERNNSILGLVSLVAIGGCFPSITSLDHSDLGPIGSSNQPDGFGSDGAVMLPGPSLDGGTHVDAAPSAPSVPGLFITTADLQRAKLRTSAGLQPFSQSYVSQTGVADQALTQTPNPFHAVDMTTLTYHWCDNDTDGIDNSLKDATTKLTQDGTSMQALALQFALTGETRYADHALVFLRAWAMNHTPVNMHDFLDYNTWVLTGATTDYCSDRPFNFALDGLFQGYGLINASDAYLLLTKNGYALSSTDDALIRAWLRNLADAVNSSFMVWTKWATDHPTSSAYERYRSDNHLSWGLAPLLAAAAALGDSTLAAYVLDGGSYVDSRFGAYTNPCPITAVIDRAIESGTGADNEGRVYEELILRNPAVGYAFFHLWAMSLVAQIADVHFGRDIWNFKGSDGAGMELAFDRYVAFIRGERPSPQVDETTASLAPDSWLYELPYRHWPGDRYKASIFVGDRLNYIEQGIGPAVLLVGENL